jgi:hypothetical protein
MRGSARSPSNSLRIPSGYKMSKHSRFCARANMRETVETQVPSLVIREFVELSRTDVLRQGGAGGFGRLAQRL